MRAQSSSTKPSSPEETGATSTAPTLTNTTNIDCMPVEILANIVDYIIKTPVLVGRLSRMNRNMHFLVGGFPLWKDMGLKIKLSPPNPEAKKYKTWFSVVGREGLRLCHWCYSCVPQNDLLRFSLDGLWTKICGNCRAAKWESEKSEHTSAKELEGGGDQANGILVGADRDRDSGGVINKGEAKRLLMLTDSDLAKLTHVEHGTQPAWNRRNVQHLFKFKEVREMARRRWGGDEGIKIRREQVAESQRSRESAQEARNEERREELRTYITSHAFEKVSEVQALSPSLANENSYEADAPLTTEEWKFIENDQAFTRCWSAVLGDRECFAPTSTLRGAKKKQKESSEGSSQKRMRRSSQWWNSASPTLIQQTIYRLYSSIFRLRLLSSHLKSAGFENGALEPIVLCSAGPHVRALVGQRPSNEGKMPEEMLADQWSEQESRGQAVTSPPPVEASGTNLSQTYEKAVQQLDLAGLTARIVRAVTRATRLIDKVCEASKGYANVEAISIALGNVARKWLWTDDAGADSNGALDVLVEQIAMYKFICRSQREPSVSYTADEIAKETQDAIDKQLDVDLTHTVEFYVDRKVQKDDLSTPWKNDANEPWCKGLENPPDFFAELDADLTKDEVLASLESIITALNRGRGYWYGGKWREAPLDGSSNTVPRALWTKIDAQMQHQVLELMRSKLMCAISTVWQPSSYYGTLKNPLKGIFAIQEVCDPLIFPCDKVLEAFGKTDHSGPNKPSHHGIAWYLRQLPQAFSTILQTELAKTWKDYVSMEKEMAASELFKSAHGFVDGIVRDALARVVQLEEIVRHVLDGLSRSHLAPKEMPLWNDILPEQAKTHALLTHIFASLLRAQIDGSSTEKGSKAPPASFCILARQIDLPNTRLREEAARMRQQVGVAATCSTVASLGSLECCLLAVRGLSPSVLQKLAQPLSHPPEDVKMLLIRECVGETVRARSVNELEQWGSSWTSGSSTAPFWKRLNGITRMDYIEVMLECKFEVVVKRVQYWQSLKKPK
ncbi:hypothetical protein M427DRAFT_349324 [Gonapodya prolifera JEL478]|uniref:F-box domain-containing protein n=1 Tax=Gonapodya prolifera (strain JEL478) TaxID=1344416 RepID=A0A139AW35_GONPJ|nr:hypothetical protein M427DRAFT_349324 [Gonapodya prolifera JEL478]|eukprot:KXS20952.1 hypothetical protein M427DRAFT_349324 [Gonapodya prolifera JEL478]